eukprot:jgi/Botrbrau1/910/Bobra.0167s0026.1
MEQRKLLELQKRGIEDRSILRIPPGLQVSGSCDFGVRHVVPPPDFSLGTSFCGSGKAVHSLPLFLLALEANVEKGRPLCFRPITITNRLSSPLRLVDIRCLPARPYTFGLLDDEGVAYNTRPHSDPWRRAAKEIPPGQSYTITVCLDCTDNPHRKNEVGVLSTIVAMSFVADRSVFRGSLPPCSSLDSPASSSVLFCYGMTASVALHAQGTPSVLSADTLPFFPDAVRKSFNVALRASNGLSSPLPALFGDSQVLKLLHQCKYGQDGYVVSSMELGKVTQDVIAHEMAWLRGSAPASSPAFQLACALCSLIQAEECTCFSDLNRYDLFNVHVAFAVMLEQAQGRAFALTTSLYEQPGSRQDGVYRGPTLRAVLHHSHPRMLVSLTVDGLPEGKPALIFGDLVYVRAAAATNVEYAMVVLETSGTRVLLGAPHSFWEEFRRWEAALRQHRDANKRRPAFHVRFSVDRTLFRFAYRALSCMPKDGDRWAFLVAALLPKPAHNNRSRGAHRNGYSLASWAEVAAGGPHLHTTTTLREVESLANELNLKPVYRKKIVELNFEQKLAIASMLLKVGTGRFFCPIVVFGPPGTGKTATVIEAVLQVYRKDSAAKILVCTPHNFAADMLAVDLAQGGVQPPNLLRLIDPRRPPNQVGPDALRLSNFNDDLLTFGLPSTEQLNVCRVVVATCTAAGLLWQYPGVRFTHVLIDESGQALLPEALIPLSFLDANGPAMLVGDPRQLGPVVRNHRGLVGVDARLSLSVSLLEALTDFYTSHLDKWTANGSASPLVMLRRNYRSHTNLLTLPNNLFYGDRLLPAADQDALAPLPWNPDEADDSSEESAVGPQGYQTHQQGYLNGSAHSDLHEAVQGSSSLVEDGEWDEAVQDSQGYCVEEEVVATPSHSLLFYGVRGQQRRDGDANSFSNELEAQALVRLIKHLLARHGDSQHPRPVTQKCIGVIATFRSQVILIRQLLRAEHLGSINVGTVQDFQGQEQRVIFISTVLTRTTVLPKEGAQARGGTTSDHVGLFHNPRKFNVATTRAKMLMVVVGHPVVLMEDPYWKRLVIFCTARNACFGAAAQTTLPRGSTEGGAEDKELEETQRALHQAAELAVLGAGHADNGEDLDDLLMRDPDEDGPWRVAI